MITVGTTEMTNRLTEIGRKFTFISPFAEVDSEE